MSVTDFDQLSPLTWTCCKDLQRSQAELHTWLAENKNLAVIKALFFLTLSNVHKHISITINNINSSWYWWPYIVNHINNHFFRNFKSKKLMPYLQQRLTATMRQVKSRTQVMTTVKVRPLPDFPSHTTKLRQGWHLFFSPSRSFLIFFFLHFWGKQ